jgi:hypothetical protein
MFLGVESRTWKGARVQAYAGQVEQVIEAGFGESLGRSLELLLWLAGTEAARLAHAELETQIARRGREVLRQAQQDHLDSRQAAEVRLPGVVDAGGWRGCGSSRTGRGGWRRWWGRCGWAGWPTVGVATLMFTRPILG